MCYFNYVDMKKESKILHKIKFMDVSSKVRNPKMLSTLEPEWDSSFGTRKSPGAEMPAFDGGAT